jgi:hypothetical protein
MNPTGRERALFDRGRLAMTRYRSYGQLQVMARRLTFPKTVRVGAFWVERGLVIGHEVRRSEMMAAPLANNNAQDG